jgi:outer membrane lipoprotein-sorting protein
MGEGMRLHVCSFILFVLMFALPASSATPTTDLGELIDAISERARQAQTMRMDFIQEKHLSLFDKSIVIKGRTLVDKTRAYLAWYVDEPVRYAFVIKGKKVWQWDEHGGKVQKVPVSRFPSLDSALTQMRLLFVGDLGQLAQQYDASLVSESPLKIQFVPKDGALGMIALKRFVVMVAGPTLDLTGILIEDKNGDSTVIDFQNVQRNPVLTEEDFILKNLPSTKKF